MAALLWLSNKACDLLCCLHLVSLSLLFFCSPTSLPPVNSTDTAVLSNPILATYVTLYLSVISCLSSLLLSVPLCVCLRLADRHTGLAVGGSGPHPALLPRGADLSVLQLQESMLQARGRHAVLCRYVKRKNKKEALNDTEQMTSKIFQTNVLSGKRSMALKCYFLHYFKFEYNILVAVRVPCISLIILYVFTILVLSTFSLSRFDPQWCSRCAAWFCSPSSSLRRSLWGCTTSLTGATAWPGDPPSSPLEEPSSTASTPRTMKTTTKIRETRTEITT